MKQIQHPSRANENFPQWIGVRVLLQAIYETNTAPSQAADPAPAVTTNSANQVTPAPATQTPAVVAIANQGVQAYAPTAEAAKQQAAEPVPAISSSTSSEPSYNSPPVPENRIRR